MHRLTGLSLFIILFAVARCDCSDHSREKDGGDGLLEDGGNQDGGDGGNPSTTVCDGGTLYTLAQLRNVAADGQCISVSSVVVQAIWQRTDGDATSSQFWVVDPNDRTQGIFIDKTASDELADYSPELGDRLNINAFLGKMPDSVDRLGYRKVLGNQSHSDGGSGRMLIGVLIPQGPVPPDNPVDAGFGQAGAVQAHAEYLSTRIHIPGPLVITDPRPIALRRLDAGSPVGYDGFEVTGGVRVDTYRTELQCPFRAAAESGIVHFPGGISGVWDTYTHGPRCDAGCAGSPGFVPGTDAGHAHVLWTLNCDDLDGGFVDPAPSLGCPEPTDVLAGSRVPLTVIPSFHGETVIGYNWSITSAPDGGIGTPDQWLPDPPQAATEQIRPFIIGNYGLHVLASGSDGGMAACNTSVRALTHGLRVELTWNGTGDLDLHLHNQHTEIPWFTDQDCFYGNCVILPGDFESSEKLQQEFGILTPDSPIWDPDSPPGMGGNPRLDFDNTVGFGPENTNIDTPLISVSYTVGIHNYASGANRIATVKIYCGDLVQEPAGTFVSRQFTGSSAGNCTSNDFWKVARVNFSSQTQCAITAIDTYSSSSQRCSEY